RLEGLAAGCHALLRLPDGVSEQGVTRAARSMSVGVRGLGEYQVGSGTKPHLWSPALVLGFGNVTETQIRRGIRRLAEAVRPATDGRGRRNR
ncbi:MAG TPA: hypothetical protein VFR11_04105, partial [Micromonosporaceae bacterium]|nr:hypothetical protein [Micromonosporaceae bacterium]